MRLVDSWRALRRTEGWRLSMLVVGLLLLIVSPLVGALPGPGGIFVFAGGLTLLLRNSAWVRRRYVLFKRRWPRHGAWTDWGLRRKSAKRREQRAKDRAARRAAIESD
jgi:hypothetical protein